MTFPSYFRTFSPNGSEMAGLIRDFDWMTLSLLVTEARFNFRTLDQKQPIRPNLSNKSSADGPRYFGDLLGLLSIISRIFTARTSIANGLAMISIPLARKDLLAAFSA